MSCLKRLHSFLSRMALMFKGDPMRFLLIASSFLLLSACVTYQPLPDGYSGPTALIVDTSGYVSSTRVHFFQLVGVDGRSVLSSSTSTTSASSGQGFVMSVREESRLVPAGDLVVSIQATTHVAAPILALGGDMHSIRGDVEVSLEEGVGYYVRGRLTRAYKAVWLEDHDGNIVSEVIEEGSRAN